MNKKECEKCVYWMPNTGCRAWFCEKMENEKDKNDDKESSDAERIKTMSDSRK